MVSRSTKRPLSSPSSRTSSAVKMADQDAATPEDGDLCGLSVRAARCIDLYLISFNASRAYIEAGYTAKSTNVANANASRLIASDKGRAYLAKRARAMFDRAELEQDRVLNLLRCVAFGDVNELVSYVRTCCRYCHGKAFRYQYTAGEWDLATTQHEEKRENLLERQRPDLGPLDPKGGVGFDGRREPRPDCPECFGEGAGRVVIRDTTNLSPAGLALFAGVKEGKDGVEIKSLDRMRAIELLAKICRLYDDTPKVNVSVDVRQLEADYAEVMRSAHERQAKIRRERFGDDAQGLAVGGAA